METEVIIELCEPMRKIIRTNLTSDGLMLIPEGISLVGKDDTEHKDVKTIINTGISNTCISHAMAKKLKHSKNTATFLCMGEELRMPFVIGDLPTGVDLSIGGKFLCSYCSLLYNEKKGIFEFIIK